MSTLNFPSNPNTGDTYTIGPTIWKWTGYAWIKAPGNNTFGLITATSIIVSTTTNSVSTLTGSLVVFGGVGIGGDLWLGGDLYAQGHYVLTTATFANGINDGTDISISRDPSGSVTIANTSTLQSVTRRGSTTTNVVTFASTAKSTSTTTGAVIIKGGLGIAGDLTLGSKIYANGATGTNGQVLTATPTGIKWDLPISTFDGGNITKPIHILATTSSIGTSTGALIVDGGVGLIGDLWAGGRVNAESVRIADAIFDSNSVNITSTAPTTIDSFLFSQYRSAKYLIQIDEGLSLTGRCQITELMMIVTNTGTVSILEYGNIMPNGDLGNFDANYINSTVTLIFIASDNIPKTVKVLRTAMAV
jgi:hypothetical protein